MKGPATLGLLVLLSSWTAPAQTLVKRHTGERMAVTLEKFETAADCVRWAPGALARARTLEGREQDHALLSIALTIRKAQLSDLLGETQGSLTPAEEITLAMTAGEAALLVPAPSTALDSLHRLRQSTWTSFPPGGLALYRERIAEAKEMTSAPGTSLSAYTWALMAEPQPPLHALILIRAAHQARDQGLYRTGQESDPDALVAAYLEQVIRLLPPDTFAGAHALAGLARAYAKKDPERARHFLGRAREALTSRNLKTWEEAGLPETFIAQPTRAQIEEFIADTARILGT